MAAALLLGCGAETDSGETAETRPSSAQTHPPKVQPLYVTLDGEAGPGTAGLLVGYELGYFEDVGIDLTVSSPIEPERSTSYVSGGVVDVGISHEPELVLARERGLSIVAVGNLLPEPTLSMIWLKKSKIDGIADLRGKTIAYPGVPFQEEFLKVVLANEGLTLSDVELERAGYDLVPALVSGRADAIFGGSWNVEGVALEARGSEPVITRAEELGIPPYDELVVIADEDRVAENPDLFRRFMEAVERGTAAAIEDPDAAAEAIFNSSFQTADLKATEAGLEVTLPLLSKTGQLDPERAGDLIDWMHEEGLIQQEPEASESMVEP